MSIDLSSFPMEFALLVSVVIAVAYLAQGLLAEYTRRTGYIKDLQIVKLLRELGDDKSTAIADEYESKILKKIDRFNHGRTPAKFALAAIVRGVPVFWVIIIVWVFIQIPTLGTETFTLQSLLYSFTQCLFAALLIEGVFSVLRPWVTPLSERFKSATDCFKDENNVK